MSAIYYPACANIAPPSCSDCPPKELGGVRSIFFIKETFAFADITSPVEWAAGICSGDIIVIPKTRGSLAISPNLTNGFGDIPQELNGYDFTLKYVDPNYLGNCSFYNTLKKNSGYLVGWRTETQVQLSSRQVLVVPTNPVDEDIKSRQSWMVDVRFVQEDLPCPSNMPAGIFDKCIAC